MSLSAAGKIPPPLVAGDRIRIVSPAGPISENSLTNSIQFLENAGYRVEVGLHAFDKEHFLAGSDESRLSDLVEALLDKSIRGVICSRGGYGSERLLGQIPWNSIGETPPKFLIGFSDIGALQITLLMRTGWMSFSGLQAANGFNSLTESNARRQFLSVLSGNWHGRLGWDDNNPVDLEPIITGPCRGLFIPICLSILCSLIGTPYLPNLRDSILCLEDVGEAPYRIDRLFWQLANSGVCEGLKGMVLGAFLMDQMNISESASRSAMHHFGNYDIPIWKGIPYGHFDNRMTLPFGAPAQIDANGLVIFE